jgi:hypothetical protein
MRCVTLTFVTAALLCLCRATSLSRCLMFTQPFGVKILALLSPKGWRR